MIRFLRWFSNIFLDSQGLWLGNWTVSMICNFRSHAPIHRIRMQSYSCGYVKPVRSFKGENSWFWTHFPRSGKKLQSSSTHIPFEKIPIIRRCKELYFEDQEYLHFLNYTKLHLLSYQICILYIIKSRIYRLNWKLSFKIHLPNKTDDLITCKTYNKLPYLKSTVKNFQNQVFEPHKLHIKIVSSYLYQTKKHGIEWEL